MKLSSLFGRRTPGTDGEGNASAQQAASRPASGVPDGRPSRYSRLRDAWPGGRRRSGTADPQPSIAPRAGTLPPAPEGFGRPLGRGMDTVVRGALGLPASSEDAQREGWPFRHPGIAAALDRSAAIDAATAGASSSSDRVVVVSNRLPDPGKPAAGGLAVALSEMSEEAKILWLGWSGETNDGHDKGVKLQQIGRTTFAQVDLSRWQHDNYYAGFANKVLWPVFHEKLEFADLDPAFSEAYREVNKKFASELAPMLRDDDLLWIHDYHLIPLAEELRALGCRQRMGFFNHIPLPPPDVIKAIPQHRELMTSLFSYDLVGMQSDKDIENLRQYVTAEGIGQAVEGPRARGFGSLSPHEYLAVASRADGSESQQGDAFGRRSSFKAFPIGIDVEKLNALVPTTKAEKVLNRVRDEAGRRRLMIGVDRLDYSKGIPTRLEAFGEFLKDNPNMQGEVTFVQVAAPTRDSVQAYRDLSLRTRELVDRINDEFGTDVWQPVIYFNTSVEREALPEMYRLSPVGVVTPSADGMNLVAKEYVAAQSPENPGVLVLSERAGAASQLRAALLVPPEDTPAIARAYERALAMPLDERQRTHATLLENVETEDLAWWRQSYLDDLRNLPGPSDSGVEKLE